jgi:hypothetical protein
MFAALPGGDGGDGEGDYGEEDAWSSEESEDEADWQSEVLHNATQVRSACHYTRTGGSAP